MPPNNIEPGSDPASQIFPQRQHQPVPPPVQTAQQPPFQAPPPPAPPMAPQQPFQVPPPQSVPPQFQPQAPFVPMRPASSSDGHGRLIAMIAVVFVVIAIGVVAAYAFFEQIGPFAHPPYNQDAMASSIVGSLASIKTASYSLHLNIVSQPKDADAVPFVAAAGDTVKLQAYKQDLDVFRDEQDIVSALETYFYSHRSYPASLSQLSGISQAHISSFHYLATDNSSAYSLVVRFQSTDAISALRSSAKMYQATSTILFSGQAVTFSNKSPSYIYLPSEPPQPFLANILGMQQYLSYIPSDFSLDGTLSGATQRVDSQNVNSQMRLQGTTDFTDINVSIDAQFEKVGDDYYVMVSKFPSFFYDLSKIKEKWIKVTSQDLAQYGSSYTGVQQSSDDLAKTKADTIQGAKIFLTVADKNHSLVSADSPVAETVNGVKTYRYDLEFNKDTMAQFYSDLTSQYQGAFGDKNPLAFDQATLDYLKSPEFDAAFEYFRKNTTLTLWADKSGIPIRFSYSIRMVPDASAKNADRQIRTTLTLDLTNINQPTVIDAPTSSMTVEDATIALTGQSKELYEFNKQLSVVRALETDLTSYKTINGVYPTSLTDLTKSSTVAKGTYAPIVKAVPVDVFTGQPFVYTNKGSDYTIVYTEQLPPYHRGDNPQGIYQMNYSYSNGMSTPKLTMAAVAGKNTADSKVVSEEAAAQSKIDSDGDGVPDVLEAYIGTNKLKKDTDGDGYSDYEELIKGTDPLGPGNLNKSSGGMLY